jgi:hypothetical protein
MSSSKETAGLPPCNLELQFPLGLLRVCGLSVQEHVCHVSPRFAPFALLLRLKGLHELQSCPSGGRGGIPSARRWGVIDR